MNNFTIGKAGNNWIYFTPFDQKEPTHAHANWPKKTEPGSAKIWIYKNGDTKIVNKGKLKDKELKEIRKFLKLNYMVLFDKWETAFKVIRIYGEPNKEFTIIDGEIIEILNSDQDSDFTYDSQF